MYSTDYEGGMIALLKCNECTSCLLSVLMFSFTFATKKVHVHENDRRDIFLNILQLICTSSLHNLCWCCFFFLYETRYLRPQPSSVMRGNFCVGAWFLTVDVLV